MSNRSLIETILSESFPLIAPIASSIGTRLTSISRSDNLDDADKQLKSLAAFIERFPDVDVVFSIMDTTVEARAVGCPFEFINGPAIITDHIYQDFSKIKHIKIPDPYENPYMRSNIEVISKLSSITESFAGAWIVGPVTLASHFMGISELVKVSFQDPGVFQEILKCCNNIIKPYAHALAEAGADLLIVLEPQVMLFSPRVYKESIRSNLEYLAKALPNPVLHVCGNTTHHISFFAKTDYFIGLSLDSMVDFKTCLKENKDLSNKILMGNIDPVSILLYGTPDLISDRVSDIITSMNGKKFILSSGCDMDPETPLESLDAFINAALKLRKQKGLMSNMDCKEVSH
ncbi:MAG: hypothetical protein JW882_16580 [Deltaproteobacteria bacterium]|nr:hypothetical protein [Deltaproteobacteria bacterium]